MATISRSTNAAAINVIANCTIQTIDAFLRAVNSICAFLAFNTAKVTL